MCREWPHSAGLKSRPDVMAEDVMPRCRGRWAVAPHRDSSQVVAAQEQRVRGGQRGGDAAQAAVADQHRRQPQRPQGVTLRCRCERREHGLNYTSRLHPQSLTQHAGQPSYSHGFRHTWTCPCTATAISAVADAAACAFVTAPELQSCGSCSSREHR